MSRDEAILSLFPHPVPVPVHHRGSCFVAPSPDLLATLRAQLDTAVPSDEGVLAPLLTLRERRRTGRNDGVIRPPADAAPGASRDVAEAFASRRAPLRGRLNVIVVLVEFSEKKMQSTQAHFEDLFFSSGKLKNGSVNEYYKEVSKGLVEISGEVVGPYLMPQTLAHYANNNAGRDKVVREMARDALMAADGTVNFKKYDNDGDDYVDAFIVVHAGRGAEQTGSRGDIWSHKWTLPDETVYETDGTNIFAYLTVPEDARIGVCAHEIGHLIFGWPDLYDTDYSSNGIGSFCLMAGGSWGGDGDMPCHPCAWCKSTQGWIDVENQTAAGVVKLEDVKTSKRAVRLWTAGKNGSEYFLIENRQRQGYDNSMPGEGLFVWHIDESQTGNEDEDQYKVALLQADGLRDLERHKNSGDANDPFPGGTGNTRLDGGTQPSTRAHSGRSSGVVIAEISASAATMTARISLDEGLAIAANEANSDPTA